jgi:hypothetical protein
MKCLRRGYTLACCRPFVRECCLPSPYACHRRIRELWDRVDDPDANVVLLSDLVAVFGTPWKAPDLKVRTVLCQGVATQCKWWNARDVCGDCWNVQEYICISWGRRAYQKMYTGYLLMDCQPVDV